MLAVFIHAANILYLLSYLVTDILWLRLITIVAGACLVPYFALRPQPDYVPIAWNGFFCLVNIVQVVRLLHQRRPVQLSVPLGRLYQLSFPEFSTRSFAALADIGVLAKAPAGEALVTAGSCPDMVLALVDGQACVSVGVQEEGVQAARERELATLGPGAFVGELSYLSREPASADVRAISAVEYLKWDGAALRKFLAKHPEIRLPLLQAWTRDLATKLATRTR